MPDLLPWEAIGPDTPRSDRTPLTLLAEIDPGPIVQTDVLTISAAQFRSIAISAAREGSLFGLWRAVGLLEAAALLLARSKDGSS